MLPSERIQEYLKDLPASYQSEVLDFVEYLKAKADRGAVMQECRDWRGIEHEESPGFALDDIKVPFS